MNDVAKMIVQAFKNVMKTAEITLDYITKLARLIIILLLGNYTALAV